LPWQQFEAEFQGLVSGSKILFYFSALSPSILDQQLHFGTVAATSIEVGLCEALGWWLSRVFDSCRSLNLEGDEAYCTMRTQCTNTT
jgi:hypothetical protein